MAYLTPTFFNCGSNEVYREPFLLLAVYSFWKLGRRKILHAHNLTPLLI